MDFRWRKLAVNEGDDGDQLVLGAVAAGSALGCLGERVGGFQETVARGSFAGRGAVYADELPAPAFGASGTSMLLAVHSVVADGVPRHARHDAHGEVWMSADEYEFWQETAYLFHSPTNARRLLEAAEAVQRGETVEHPLDRGWRLVFTPQNWQDYIYWQRVDPAVVKRINCLLNDAPPNPKSGIGKLELLSTGPRCLVAACH